MAHLTLSTAPPELVSDAASDQPSDRRQDLERTGVGRWNDPYLLEQAEAVELRPVLGDLPVLEAEEIEAPDRDASLRRRHPVEDPLVGPAERRPLQDEVSLAELLLDRHLVIRKRLAQLAEVLLEALAITCDRPVVVDEV